MGDIARNIYDPEGIGQLIDPQSEGFDAAFDRTIALLDSTTPIFEAGFTAAGARAFADVMLPTKRGGKKVWRMIEVKSSASIKDYHRDDVAVQAFIAKSAGVPLASISLAHIDSSWVYPGGNDYQGLLIENDLTVEAFDRESEVKEWIAGAQKVASRRTEPVFATGQHCEEPYECGFYNYCKSKEPQAEYPVRWLPGAKSKALKSLIEEEVLIDLHDIPDELLNARQLRVKSHTLSGEVYFDRANAASDLASYKLPAYFLDFETIHFTVPIWKGTRPFQKIPFQFSLHRLARTGKLEHQSFLNLSGNNPSKIFAESLIVACGTRGSVFVYNAGFEGARIRELAERFPEFAPDLLAIKQRLVDLLPITKAHYYHPSQHGSWSIKAVLPAVAPDLGYGILEGVQDGGMAMEAYLEAIHPDALPVRKAEIEKQLLAYCGLDTFAMVRLWQFLAGRNDLEL